MKPLNSQNSYKGLVKTLSGNRKLNIKTDLIISNNLKTIFKISILRVPYEYFKFRYNTRIFGKVRTESYLV